MFVFRMIDSPDIAITIILTSLLILLLIFGITLSFFLIGRQRAKQRIILSEAEIKYEQELRKVEIELSESLFEHFGQELHDNIGHLLACLRIELENRKLDNPLLIEQLKSVDTYLEESITQLSLLSRSLNTDYISKLNLTEAIQMEIQRLKQLKKVKIHWQQDNSRVRLDQNQSLVVFRIFQEIVSNTLRHSRAKNLYIILKNDPNFELKVKDDGQGFDYEKISNSSKASGLKNIIKRAHMASLKCQISSEVNKGCICNITEHSEDKGSINGE